MFSQASVSYSVHNQAHAYLVTDHPCYSGSVRILLECLLVLTWILWRKDKSLHICWILEMSTIRRFQKVYSYTCQIWQNFGKNFLLTKNSNSSELRRKYPMKHHWVFEDAEEDEETDDGCRSCASNCAVPWWEWFFLKFARPIQALWEKWKMKINYYPNVITERFPDVTLVVSALYWSVQTFGMLSADKGLCKTSFGTWSTHYIFLWIPIVSLFHYLPKLREEEI